MSTSRLFLIFLVQLTVCTPAFAQESPPVTERSSITGVGSLNFMVGVPTGQFQDNVDGVGFGGAVFGGIRFSNTPVVLGADLGFLIYGRTVDTVPFSSTVGPRVMVDVVTTNSIVEPHLVLRLQPESGIVRPYLDGLFGLKYLATQTTVRDQNSADDEDDTIASSTNFSDATVSGGIGAGLDIRLYRPSQKEQEENKLRTVSLHLGVQYVRGGQAEYLAEGSLEDTNGNGELDEEELDIRQSSTTLIQPRIGVTLTF